MTNHSAVMRKHMVNYDCRVMWLLAHFLTKAAPGKVLLTLVEIEFVGHNWRIKHRAHCAGVIYVSLNNAVSLATKAIHTLKPLRRTWPIQDAESRILTEFLASDVKVVPRRLFNFDLTSTQPKKNKVTSIFFAFVRIGTLPVEPLSIMTL